MILTPSLMHRRRILMCGGLKGQVLRFLRLLSAELSTPDNLPLHILSQEREQRSEPIHRVIRGMALHLVRPNQEEVETVRRLVRIPTQPRQLITWTSVVVIVTIIVITVVAV